MRADNFFLTLGKAHATVTKSADGLLAPYGLSYARWQIIRKVIENGDKSRPSRIANELGLSKASVTGLVEHLEKAGLMGRRPCEKDGRQTCVYMTEKGSALAKTIAPLVEKHMESMFGTLPEAERVILLRSLHTLTDYPPLITQK